MKYVRKLGYAVPLLAVVGSAHAAGGVADIFAAVDLSTVTAFVVATGVIIIGIALAFKGISLGKRGISKA
jgi:hypothetical protein